MQSSEDYKMIIKYAISSYFRMRHFMSKALYDENNWEYQDILKNKKFNYTKFDILDEN